jgi:hypothetical protein
MIGEACHVLTISRGYPGGLLTALRDRGLIGLWEGSPAFPIFSAQGEVVGCQIRFPQDWIIKWFTPDESLHKVTPLVLKFPSQSTFMAARQGSRV